MHKNVHVLNHLRKRKLLHDAVNNVVKVGAGAAEGGAEDEAAEDEVGLEEAEGAAEADDISSIHHRRFRGHSTVIVQQRSPSGLKH